MAERSVVAPASLRPRWEVGALAATYFIAFVLRDAGVPFGLDFDVIRAGLVVLITVLTLRTIEASWTVAWTHLALAATVVITEVLSKITGASGLEFISRAISLYLVLIFTLALLAFLLRRQRVSGDALVGALAVYLALGVLFGLTYTSIALIDPQVFDPPQHVSSDSPSPLYYYSYVTLTTLGYGDIGPASSVTRVLAALEAVVGVVLLAILVGRIVGMLVSQQSQMHIDLRFDALAKLLTRDAPADSPHARTTDEPAVDKRETIETD